jgi:ubiquinone/menaquinone biosynthesis C-methylase UbiE
MPSPNVDQTLDKSHYVIRGGIEGRNRLRILSRVMWPSTLSLLQRAGIQLGMACLDVGCGGGDVSCELARLVGPAGRVVGMDIDEVKIAIAREEAAASKISNLEFRVCNLCETEPKAEFDLVYARFLLTHLQDPSAFLAKIFRALRPSGTLVVADIDFRGYFSYPESPALARYVSLYTEAVKRRGADPNIGPRLPALLAAAGFENVQVTVAQPAALDGEVKLISPLTMENIADAVMAEGLASRAEIEQIVGELYTYARTPGTIGCMPRVVEAWGHRSPV